MRQKFVKFRVNDDELSQLKENAGGQKNVSEFIRSSVLSGASKARSNRNPVRKADPELIRHIGLIGNNINQLARWCNTYKSSIDAHNVCELLEVISGELSAVREHHSNDD